MVSNFKTGQMTPIIYLAFAVTWWAFRRGNWLASGAVLALPTLVKPYFAAPLALFFRPSRWRGVLAFGLAYLAGIALSVLIFDVQTVIEYYRVLFDHAAGIELGGAMSVADWSVESVKPLFALGPLALPVQLASGVPVAYLAVFDDEDHALELFSLSIVMLMFLVSQTSVIDLGVLLAPLLVLGVRAYDRSERRLTALAAAFLLLHAHPYFMEAFVGRGHPNLVSVLPEYGALIGALLQPATYGCLLLYGVAVHAAFAPRISDRLG